MQLHMTPEQFQAPRLPGDRNLVEEVNNMLFAGGALQQQLDYFLGAGRIQEAVKLRPEAQRFLINEFFLLQLARIKGNTMEARSCLQAGIPMDHWVYLIGHYVVPALVQNDRPGPL